MVDQYSDTALVQQLRNPRSPLLPDNPWLQIEQYWFDNSNSLHQEWLDDDPLPPRVRTFKLDPDTQQFVEIF